MGTLATYRKRRIQNSFIYLFLIVGLLALFAGVYQGGMELIELEPEEMTLSDLPHALALSFLRMGVSYFASLIFAFILGLLAATTLWGERIIIPTVDILQSVPVVGFFPAAIAFFISLTQEHRLGVELAAIFLIFTSQAWNLVFAVYEAIKRIPQDHSFSVKSLGVKGSQLFWKLYAPACVPRLVYNSILSWSNGWFFLVACEIIAVGPARYHLPGIGSFLATAAENDQVSLVLWGLFALTVFVVGMDYLIWRPISVWSEKFKSETGPSQPSAFPALSGFLLDFLRPLSAPLKQILRALFFPIIWFLQEVLLPLVWDLPKALFDSSQVQKNLVSHPSIGRFLSQALLVILALSFLCFCFFLFEWLRPPWPDLITEIPMAILASTGRLLIALALCLSWVLPVVFWAWNRPKARQFLGTIAQIGASLPAIALFPLFIVLFVKNFEGGMEIAAILLLLNGMQWYLLFNCLGGTATIPQNLKEATFSLGMRRLHLWKRLVIPSIRPALVTGAITAWGGGWNALVVAEYIRYREDILTVRGMGALLNRAVYELGDQKAITLCIVAMVGWILFVNLVFWRPIYQSNLEKFRFET